MKITHTVLPTGHFVTMTTEMSVRTVRTEHGTPTELIALAQEMEDKAEMLRLKAISIRHAASLVAQGVTNTEALR